jgi:glutathione S-transferase
LEEFETIILPILDKKLSKFEFLCCDEYTIADIVVYNELMTVFTLCNKKVESKMMPNLFSWYNRIANIPEI